MKKKLIFLMVIVFILIVTGCGKKEKTVEYLLDSFIKAYTTADIEIVKEIFPPFYIEYGKDYMNKEYFEQALEADKYVYGEDFNISYNYTGKRKLEEEELTSINGKMKTYYNAQEDASECYSLEGTMTFKGTKKINSESLSSFRYCNYNGIWYLVRG